MNPPPAAVERSACAKIILCGEHAVVYGRPAIALPLPELRARAVIEPAREPFHILAADLGRQYDPATHPDHPLVHVCRLAFDLARPVNPQSPISNLPDLHARLTLTSDIPVSAHLGSSAAVSVACARAVAAFCGRELSPAEASDLAYEAEKLHHGTPSGIDNTVVAHEAPIWFRRSSQKSEVGSRKPEVSDQRPATSHQQPATSDQFEVLSAPPAGMSIVIADTGIATPTRIPVGEVRAAWEADPARHERLFDRIGEVVAAARAALAAGDWPRLGGLLDANHALLRELGVSCDELDHLCDAARRAGALGAKLSGGGRGGNMIALARDAAHAADVRAALVQAGAKRVI